MGWKSGAVAVLSLALSVDAAYAQADANEVDVPVVRQCLKETGASELRQCVRDLARLVTLGDKINVLERRMVGTCIEDDKTLDEVRACLKSLAKPDPKRESRAAALEGAMRTWDTIRGKSRMNDVDNIYLRLESDDEVADSAGTRSRPILWVRCLDNVTSVIVYGEWFLPDNVSVTWRIDKDKPVAQTWDRSDNYKSAGLWEGGRAIPLIKSMLGKETFLIRLAPRNSGAKEMSFNIAGLDVAIEPLRKACKW